MRGVLLGMEEKELMTEFFQRHFGLREYTWVVLCSEKVLSDRHG